MEHNALPFYNKRTNNYKPSIETSKDSSKLPSMSTIRCGWEQLERKTNKLDRIYCGPYMVKRIDIQVNVTIESIHDGELLTVNCAKLKPYRRKDSCSSSRYIRRHEAADGTHGPSMNLKALGDSSGSTLTCSTETWKRTSSSCTNSSFMQGRRSSDLLLWSRMNLSTRQLRLKNWIIMFTIGPLASTDEPAIYEIELQKMKLDSSTNNKNSVL